MPRPRENAERPLTPAEKQARYRQRQAAARTAELQKKNMPATAPIPTMPSKPRWTALTLHAQETLRTMQEEMTAYYDDRSEQWQESEKGQEFQEKLDALDSIISDLDNLI